MSEIASKSFRSLCYIKRKSIIDSPTFVHKKTIYKNKSKESKILIKEGSKNITNAQIYRFSHNDNYLIWWE